MSFSGARVHNLKEIDVTIPRDKLVVLTGLSGSGKSSLAFDTIYAEGQRRYVESLSAYARQFLGQMDKPDVDAIEGLSPAISIDQKTTTRNPRSTVGTVTEIYDYLRLLFARIGRPVCPEHGIEISAQTLQQMVDRIMELPERTRMQILAPVVQGAQRGTRQAAEGDRPARVCPRPGRRGDAGAYRGDPAGEKQKAYHRSGGGPDRGEAGHRNPAGGFPGDGAQAGRTARCWWTWSAGRSSCSAQPGLSRVRLQHRRNCPRGCFPSTAPTAPVPPVTAWEAGWRWIPIWWFPTGANPSGKGRSEPWAGSPGSYYEQCWRRSAIISASIGTRPSPNCPKRAAKLLLYGSPENGFPFEYESDFGGLREAICPL